jgi:type IV secretory pathway VirB2 component (pilin)
MQATFTRLDTHPGSIFSRTRNAGFFALAVLIGSAVSFAAETGSNLPWEGPLNTLVTSLTGPVAYAISVIAIVALGATLAFAGGEMGETMKRLLQVGIAVCLVVFAAQVMSSFIGQAAEVSLLQPVHAVSQPVLRLFARG